MLVAVVDDAADAAPAAVLAAKTAHAVCALAEIYPAPVCFAAMLAYSVGGCAGDAAVDVFV